MSSTFYKQWSQWCNWHKIINDIHNDQTVNPLSDRSACLYIRVIKLHIILSDNDPTVNINKNIYTSKSDHFQSSVMNAITPHGGWRLHHGSYFLSNGFIVLLTVTVFIFNETHLQVLLKQNVLSSYLQLLYSLSSFFKSFLNMLSSQCMKSVNA